jgi:hypothetical protein
LFCFDFAGCGQSEGEYISLGFHEAEDLKAVLDHVCALPSCERVALYGRSMGSSAVMHYAAKYEQEQPKLACLIFDGIFESLRAMMLSVAKKHSFVLGLAAPLGVPLMRRRIREKAGFSTDDVDPKTAAGKIKALPGLFLHAKEDELFDRHQMEAVMDQYGPAEKTVVDIEGNHNDFRAFDFWSSVEDFLVTHLKLGEDRTPARAFPLAKKQKKEEEEEPLIAQVVPFAITVDGMLDQKFEAMVLGPLQVVVERDQVRCLSRFSATKEAVWTVRFVSFQGMGCSEGMFRIMLSPNSGFLIQTSQAVMLAKKVDVAIGAVLREEFLNNLPAMLERIESAASVLLEEYDRSVEKVTTHILKEVGMEKDETITVAVRNAVQKVANQKGPKVLKMK